MNANRTDRRPVLIAAALATVLVAGAGVALLAGPRGPRPDRGPGGDPGARMERAIEQLDLSPDQAAAVEAIVAERRAAAPDRMEAMRAARQRLGETIHADVLDEGAIRAAAAEVATLEADGAVERATTLHAIRAELTAEQRAELEAMLQERQENREQRRRGPRGRGPVGAR